MPVRTFVIGRKQSFMKDLMATIVTTGHLVWGALIAAKALGSRESRLKLSIFTLSNL
jgi:transketolase C-terminal domain/subunit